MQSAFSHKFLKPLWLTLLLGMALEVHSQTELAKGHTDVGVAYEDGQWDLHVGRHEDSPPAEYAPSEVVLQLLPAAETTIPHNQAFSFLGEPGAPIYVLPEVEHPALLFLGLSAEELPSGLFTNDQVKLELKSLTGPGEFFLYQVDALGTPAVLMNSRDGITAEDNVRLLAGGHQHANWAFTTPGVYEVVFEASGTLVDNDEFTASGPVTYRFRVMGDSPNLYLSATPDGLHLQWLSVLGVNYQLQLRENLDEGGWSNWGSSIPGTGSQVSAPVPNTSASAFFRVMLE